MDGSSPQKSAGKRSTLDMLMEMVEASHDPIVPTKLMYRCNINYRTFHILLNKLITSKLVDIIKADPSNGRVKYKVKSSNKGKEALKFYYSLLTKAGARL